MIKTIENTPSAYLVAAKLLEIGAIKLNISDPFSWSSGWKSPIYCDNRLSLSFPEIRTFIKTLLTEQIQENFSDTEAIAGVATAGIPQGVLVAESLGLPFLYVRSKPKEHGMTNMIEGKITPGQKIVLIEDLVSTGGSSLKAASALKSAGFRVLGMMAIFTYGFQIAEDNFRDAGLPLICLSNYHYLIEEAMKQGIVEEAQTSYLRQWREHPDSWGQ